MADPMLVDILYRASERVAAFHQHQVRNSFLVNEEDGILMGQKIIPLERVGLYVPGGTAAYPSSVIMNCIPGQAGRASKRSSWSRPRQGREDPPQYLSRRPHLRRQPRLPRGRGTGHSRPGLRHRERAPRG